MKVYSSPIDRPTFSFDTYQKDEEKYLTEVLDWVKTNGSGHALSGEIVRTPIADGYAQYVIAYIDKEVSLVHLEIGDEWRDDRLERFATIAELEHLVERQRSLNALVGR